MRAYFEGRTAICQAVAPGQGKPQFGKPHSQRQREAIARGLCDLCGRPLKLSTKVSLSHARPQPHGAQGWAILQVEPMLHKECAAESVRYCPSLRRDIANGTLMVLQVTRWRAQAAIMNEVYVESIMRQGARLQAALKTDVSDAEATLKRIIAMETANCAKALHDLVAPPPAQPAKPVPAVPVRTSVKPHAITSLIDGKPYKVLRRHIALHGYTPESYRAAFGLPADYPMTAAEYSERRSKMAVGAGLGRKRG